jgi:prophage regulatory protein
MIANVEHERAQSGRLLRLPIVMDRTGLSRSGLYGLINREQFPAPVRLGDRAIAWREDEVAEWIASRPAARSGGR